MDFALVVAISIAGYSTSPFHFGETITSDLVNYNGNYPYGNAPKNGLYRQQPTEVGSFKYPNAFRLYDMHGNVWEWCSDIYHENYNNIPKDSSSWQTGTVDNYHARRGCSWLGTAFYCRSAYRAVATAVGSGDFIGFRLVVA